MTSTEPATRPIDAVTQRLDDPAVAASLVTLLDNAELLSTLVLGLSGLIARSESIMDSVAEGVHDFRAAGGGRPEGAPSLAEMTQVARELSDAAPVLQAVLSSAMTRPETIELLSVVSEAATEGAAAARSTDARVGTVGLMRALRDDDVQRGLGLVIEISRALGRRLPNT